MKWKEWLLLYVQRHTVFPDAYRNLAHNERLWRELIRYQDRSQSTGCSLSDYWELYKAVRLRKPKEILECGPGVSTLILSYALMENEQEGFRGRITAMEELESYRQMAEVLLPDYLHPYVEFIQSPRVEESYSLFRGVRYRDVPDRAFDFIFVDGPDLRSPSDGTLTFDFDYLHIVRNSEIPVYGIVDYRLSTSYVLQIVFGTEKVKFSALQELAFVGPCTKYDLIPIELEPLTEVFLRNARFLGKTQLSLR
jgi:hypothetical protein